MLARHVSGNSYAYLQEHWTIEYSLWYEAPYMLPAVGLDMDGLFITSLMFLKMGITMARNMSS